MLQEGQRARSLPSSVHPLCLAPQAQPPGRTPLRAPVLMPRGPKGVPNLVRSTCFPRRPSSPNWRADGGLCAAGQGWGCPRPCSRRGLSLGNSAQPRGAEGPLATVSLSQPESPSLSAQLTAGGAARHCPASTPGILPSLGKRPVCAALTWAGFSAKALHLLTPSIWGPGESILPWSRWGS